MPALSPFDILAEEIGAVAGRIERESVLRIDAAISEIRRIDAERELRLTQLERRIEERLAGVKDGAPGASVTTADVAPLVAEEIQRAVAALPPAAPGKDADPTVAVEMLRTIVEEKIAAAVAAIELPEPREVDRAVLTDIVAAEVAKLPPAAPGKDADPADIEAAVARAVAALPAPLNGKDADPAMLEEMVSRAVAALPAAKNGEPGKDADPEVIAEMVRSEVAKLPPPTRGEPGAPGKLPIVRAWTEKVHYEGDVVTSDGSTYQATRDTGKSPPHEDWVCIATAGRNGNDGRSFTIEGTYNDKTEYRALSVVALNGAAFAARIDNPGPCPGEDWQLIASQGKQGKPGEGRKGDPGQRGLPGPSIVAMDVNDHGLLTVTNGDGSIVTCDLYPLLSKLAV